MNAPNLQPLRGIVERVLIVDQQALIRLGLAMTVSDLWPSVAIVEAGTIEEAVDLVSAGGKFGLVIVDPAMGQTDGFGGLGTLRELLTGVPLVVVSASEDPTNVRRALACGAQGYIVKSATTEVLKRALQLILSGESYVPSVVYNGRGFWHDGNGSPDPRPARRTLPRGPLTPRETDVLTLMGRGMSNKEIALDLGLREGTVKVHARSIFQKLGVRNRTCAVVAGVRAGHIPPGTVARST